MLDLYPQPYGERAPVVVWVHGGGWMLGDKANQLADKVTHFASEGVLFVSVNYRLSPQASDNPAPDRVMHPVHAQDVARALAWVKAHAAEYGGDPDRVALIGHSAGGHLVSLVATAPEFLGAHGWGPSAVRCTAALDTEGYDIPGAMAGAGALQRKLYENAFGTDPATWTAASPITHVKAGAGIGPFLVARRGSADRQARANDFRDALLAAGIPVTVVDVSAYDHEGVNDAVGRSGETVLTPALETFFDDCLR
jgi:acetyl esterase/lipase